MAPYTEKLDSHKYELPDLLGRIYDRIDITKQCLAGMTEPIQSPFQEHTYGEYIRRIKELILEANTDISDIKANHRQIFVWEFKHLKTSLYNIERKTSAVYSDLCTWKASHTKSPAAASKECAAAVETKHTTLTKSPELNQGRDTKGVSTVKSSGPLLE